MRASVRVGPIVAEPGQIARGLIPVGELADGCSPIQIPVIVVNGRDDGPLAYLHAGSHGQETAYAIEMMRLLVRADLDPERLRGAVVLVPAANLLAHQAASRIAPHYGVREGGAFGGDMHKLWPGDADGSVTQRLASAIWREIVAQADLIVDYHTNSSPGLPFALLYQHSAPNSPGAEEVWRRTVELARAFGLTVVRGAPTPNALSGASMLAGKPALMIEIPSPRMLSAELVACARLGTRNLLARAGLIDGPIEPQRGVPVLEGDHEILPSVRASRGGLVHFEVEPGVRRPAGAVIARVYDVFGDELEALGMPADGYVSTFPPLSWAGAQTVATGDYVADCFS